MVIFLLAIGLSMDAFSLAILYGTLGFTKHKMFILSIIVGIFHFFMPLLGNVLGNVICDIINVNLDILVGFILVMIGLEMLVSLSKDEKINNLINLSSLFLFGFTVSMDSFSVGMWLPILANNHVFVVSIFSIISFSFTFIGLLVGKKLNEIFGKIANIIGSVILIVLGIIYIF